MTAAGEEHVSRRRLLGTAGAALGGAGLLALTQADSAAAAPPSEFEVRNYGASGNGATNDTAAIQAAINAARDRGGGTVVFQAGTFIVGKPLVIYSKITLRGAGVAASILKKANGSAPFTIVQSDRFASLTGSTSADGVQNASLQNLGFDGNADGGAGGNGVELYGFGHTLFNVTIGNCAGRGLWSEFGGPLSPGESIEAMLVDVKVRDCIGGGIWWAGPHDSQWVNVLVHTCGPRGVLTGSPTRAIEVKPAAAGLRVTNGHVWGLNHAYAWYLDCRGVGLVNCSGEGAELAQVVVIGNDCSVIGGHYFASRDGNQTVGIQIGVATATETAGTYVNTKVINCNLGSLKFVNDAGVGRYVITAWQPGGDLVVVDPPGTALRTSNRYDLLVRGGAGYGALGTFQPLTVEGLAARGDVRAGADATSRLGFFGVAPQARSSGWTTQALSDDRNLGASADAAELRNVLGTLIEELKRYGLLA